MSLLQQKLAQLHTNCGKSSLFPDSPGGLEVLILSPRTVGGCLLMFQALHTCVEEQLKVGRFV